MTIKWHIDGEKFTEKRLCKANRKCLDSIVKK